MKKMYPTTPILTTPNDHRSIASMNTGRLLRNAYLTSRDEYPSSLLPYNPGLGDLWISSIHQHDYAMQFIRGKVLPYVISPIAKVNYWDGILRTDILPYHGCYYYAYTNSRLVIPASVYILAVLSISSLRRYVKDKDDLLKTTIIKEIVATIVRKGEAEYYAAGFYQYTGFSKEPDICDIYFPSPWTVFFWVKDEADYKSVGGKEVFFNLIKLYDDLAPLLFDLIIKAHTRYPIRRLEGIYGKEYYCKSSEFINKLSKDVKFYRIERDGTYVADRVNKYFMMPEIFKVRIKYPEKGEE
jgi:hypothetical protein